MEEEEERLSLHLTLIHPFPADGVPNPFENIESNPPPKRGGGLTVDNA